MNTYQRKVTDNSNMDKCWAWKYTDYTLLFSDGAPGIKLLLPPEYTVVTALLFEISDAEVSFCAFSVSTLFFLVKGFSI